MPRRSSLTKSAGGRWRGPGDSGGIADGRSSIPDLLAWIVRRVHPILSHRTISRKDRGMSGKQRMTSAPAQEAPAPEVAAGETAPGNKAEKAVPAWGAVFTLALGVFALVTAEFLPASLLTPMAADLRVTEGAAGQAVTAAASVALATSLLIAAATRRIDRRHVLLAFSILLILSNLLVAFAPSLPVLLAGRVLLGAAIGGFWTMSAAITMKLVPTALVPRALSILFSGVS